MRRFLFPTSVVATTLVACAAILDIEELPVRPEGTDAAPDSTVVDSGDSGDAGACIEPATKGCVCPHAFCDDFDHEDGGEAGTQWISAVTPGGGPFTRQKDGGILQVGLTDQSLSPPYALGLHLESTSGAQHALYLRKMGYTPGPTFAGVRYRFATRVRELKFTEIDGPVADAGSAFIAGVIFEKFPPAGVLLIVAEEGMYLAANSQDVFEASGFTGVTPIYEGTKISTVFGATAEGEIMVTTKTRAIAEGVAKCSAVDATYVVTLRMGGALQGCVLMPPEFGDLAWTATSVIGIGAGAFGDAVIDVIHDNVRVDFLE